MRLAGIMLAIAALAAALAGGMRAQAGPAAGAAQLNVAGHVTVDGRPVNYLIRHLPVNAFPELPAKVKAELDRRGCLIPQSYEARRPENVVRGAFEKAGTQDWAVLCSAQGTAQLLVFFASAPDKPAMLISWPETQRLQAHDATGSLGFNWAIDRATPEQIHTAQAGMTPRPAKLDHDAVADMVIDRKRVDHYFAKGEWSKLDVPE